MGNPLRSGQKGFTLIELMISVALVVLITGAIYFCINGALESWTFSRDELGLQKVLSETMNRVTSGTPERYGMKDSLEIVEASRSGLQFVTPWIDDTHSVSNLDFIYTLNRRMKPGSPAPIAQIQLPESKDWQIVPVAFVDLENTNTSQAKLRLAAPEGIDLRFIYHPDPIEEPDTVKKISWDSSANEVFFEDPSQKGNESLSKNLFGALITKMELRYFTNSNQLITDRETVELSDLPIITGIEVLLEASLNEKKKSLKSFISLRNAPMRTGYLSLRKDLRIHIPDSKRIHTLMLTNFSGIVNNDKIQLEAQPKTGKTWRLTAQFEKIGGAKPIIKTVTVEYPQQNIVFTDTPRSNAELGLNFSIIDTNGLYDYDDDDDVDDIVLLEGDVELTVKEMDIKGAGLFVRP